MKAAQHKVAEETRERHGYVISHADFPHQDYSANIESLLIIKNVHSQQIIQIKFLVFDLYYKPGESSCNYDYMYVKVSKTVSGRRKFCGEPANKPALQHWYNFTVSGATAEIKFKTNGNPTVGKGFYFEYRGK